MLRDFFLSFIYKYVDIAMENHSERTQKIVIICQVGRIQILISQHYQTNWNIKKSLLKYCKNSNPTL